MEVADLRVMGRATQGVKLLNLKGNDSIAAVAKVKHDEDEIEDETEGLEEETPLNNENTTSENSTSNEEE